MGDCCWRRRAGAFVNISEEDRAIKNTLMYYNQTFSDDPNLIGLYSIGRA